MEIAAMPAAARVNDMHTCKHQSPVPHVGGPIVTGCPTVLIGKQPAARVGDAAQCVPLIDTIVQGEPTVMIGFKAAARVGDRTDGGLIIAGCPTVLIGVNHGEDCMKDAADSGAPFVALDE
jgi:uncharacterized Zn-binding protein involved in type VI secretion